MRLLNDSVVFRLKTKAEVDAIQPRLGHVKCQTCGKVLVVDSAWCVAYGWPKCCGTTMRLLSATDTTVEPF